MPRVSREILVARAPADVFASLVSPAARAKWVATLIEEPSAEAVLRVGSVVRAVRRHTTTGSRYALTIVALDPERRLVLDVARNGAHVGRNSFDLGADPAGTRVSAVAEFELHGLQRMMTPVVTATMERDLEAELAALKRFVESVS